MKEKHIEKELIDKLVDLKYVYRDDINSRASLEQNFRQKFEELNRVKLSDNEFDRLMEKIITSDVFQASQKLRERNVLQRDDDTPLYFTLVNTQDWCKNTFEVINQLRMNTEYSKHIYDVVLLLNGVPVVQIELKTLQVSANRAMKQIVDYKKDVGNGYTKTLMCFLQLFIVSNGNDTWYFVNNNNKEFSFGVDEQFLPVYQFAEKDNSKVTNLDEFVDKFLAKCTLGQMISRYMVLVASEQKLMMMRPYQIYAVQAIVECIKQNVGNGFIWHTTGSGKTLTSFKASTLLKDNRDIEKCLFVVDRKDLDRQTREEFNKFQDGCVEENTNTATLVDRLLSDDYADKVIVTTIQKLGHALSGKTKKNYKEQLKPLQDKRMVFIFDECHRSQFGDNHKAIKEFFPKAQLFGFTGTPIFEKNSNYRKVDGTEATSQTTKDIFQQQLHAYTITNAIDNKNVLRFRIDYFKPEGKNPPKPGEPIDKTAIVNAILDKHDAVTAQRKFNAIFATASINDAIAYFELFQTAQTERQGQDPKFKPLNIACVFSPPAGVSPDIRQFQEDLTQETEDNKQDPEKKKAALTAILKDYNETYGTTHQITEFDKYYQNVQERIKNQKFPLSDVPHSEKIDITIVVDMLLTGFDSKYLNTLYVDKNLKYHGLIQAFSRTNRVLNDTKPFGNILDFRQQAAAVNQAIATFSGESTKEQAAEIWCVKSAPEVITQLADAKEKLDNFMQSQGLESAPSAVANLKGDAARAQFVNLFKAVQKQANQLDQYTDITATQKDEIEAITPNTELRGFKGVYLGVAKRLQAQQKMDNPTPEVDQLDFEYVLFSSQIIDYDYIMELVAEFTSATPSKEKMTREQIVGLIASDSKFMDDRSDIEAYINTLEEGSGLTKQDILDGFEAFKAEKSAKECNAIAQKHGIVEETLSAFVSLTLGRYVFDDMKLTEVLAPLGLGWKARKRKKEELMTDLIPYLKKLAGGRDISGLSVYE